MNDNEELYEEFEDQDADIKEKEALIEEAEKLKDIDDWNELAPRVNDLQRAWRRIHYWESGYEDELKEKFDAIMDTFYDKKREADQAGEQIKEDLIKKAEEVSQSEDWKNATQQMKDLMTQWKAAPRLGRRKDDELWNRFNAARQTFYTRKHEHWEDMKEHFEDAREAKEKLIVEAEALKDSEEWQKAGNQFKDLMTRWKEAGNAGREYEDDLWERFNGARQHFYQRRNAFYEELHKTQDANYQAKQELIEKAKAIEATKDYSRENTQTMKDFGVQWKEIGSCGRARENEIWNSFRTVMDDYFDGLKELNAKKHEEWKERMANTIDRKKYDIENEKRRISRLEEDLRGLNSQSRMDEIEDEIDEAEEEIHQLEDEIADIESKISEE